MTNNENGSAPSKNPPPPLQVTSAREWRRLRKDGIAVQLPSGMVARLRPVSLIDLWKAGTIPDALTALVADLLVNGTLSAEKSEMTGDLIETIGNLYDTVCRSAFVSPRIVADPIEDADEIEFEDVSQTDREFVLGWCSTPTTELRRFPDTTGQQVPPVEPVVPSASVRPKAKPAPQDS